MSRGIYRNIILINTLVGWLAWCPVAMAWDDETTHRDLSEAAAQRSVLGTGYLQNDLKINAGLNINLRWEGGEIGENQTIVRWIQEGGEFEDASGRFFNHFHNPIHANPWDNAGLDDSVLLIPTTGGSALQWAQNAGIFQGPDHDPNLDWSWQATRNYFYQALTSPQKVDQDAFLAQTFRGLGNQIHLIQDMSQPSHVRNDAHPEDPLGVIPFTNIRWIERLENWARTHQGEAQGFMDEPSVFPMVTLNSVAGNFIPTANFWDTDQYDGTAATLPLTAGTTVGLAEYTNANFFSDSTINSSRPRHQFNFPSTNIQDYTICADEAPSGSLAERRWYISREPCPQDPQQDPDHFLASSFLPAPQPTEIGRNTQLDDRVYSDYAQQLLPRAVGYSAGLINYFFRGQLVVVPAPGGIIVRNESGETMGMIDPDTQNVIGTISVYYDDNGTPLTRHPLASLNLPTPLASGDSTPLISFTHPTDNILPRRYIIVYRGPLGAEQDAVIGRVTAPLQVFYRSDEDGPEKIFRVDIDGRNKTLVFDNTDPDIIITAMDISPDLTQLAFTHGQSIAIVDLNTGVVSTLVQGPVTSPSWSPDGNQMIYDKGFGCQLPCIPPIEIIKRDLTLGTETQLTTLPNGSDNRSPVNTQPAWSADGTLIVHSMQLHDVLSTKTPDCINNYVIALIDQFGQPEGRLTCSADTEYSDREPAWSPDGQEIAFVRQLPAQGLSELFKVQHFGGTLTKLTESAGPNFLERTPAWSPEDANLIAVGSTRDGDFDIWLVDPNGGGYLRNLTDDNPGIDGNPTFGWVP